MAKKINTMDSIKFLRYNTEFGYRYRIEGENIFLMDLADFLLTEIACSDASYWLRCINELKEGGAISGNMMGVKKRGNNLYLSYAYDDPEYPSEPLKILEQTLITLIVTWEKLMHNAPEEISLVHDGDTFELR
jgi:hypothetical protein